MNNNDTLRVQILIEYWADERYKQQAYAACRREFWEKLGQALYEADGIFTVEIDEKREWAMLPNRGEVVTFTARFTKVQFRPVVRPCYHYPNYMLAPKQTFWQKIEGWFKKGK